MNMFTLQEAFDEARNPSSMDESVVAVGLAVSGLIAGAVAGFKVAKSLYDNKNAIIKGMFDFLQKEGVIYNLKQSRQYAMFNFNQHKMKILYGENGTYEIVNLKSKKSIYGDDVSGLSFDEYKKRIGKDIVAAAVS